MRNMINAKAYHRLGAYAVCLSTLMEVITMNVNKNAINNSFILHFAQKIEDHIIVLVNF